MGEEVEAEDDSSACETLKPNSRILFCSRSISRNNFLAKGNRTSLVKSGFSTVILLVLWEKSLNFIFKVSVRPLKSDLLSRSINSRVTW